MAGVRIFTILIALICLNDRLDTSEANYCYSDDEHPYLLAGTKTPYNFIHGLIKNASVPNCEPMQIWMLIRHGTRNPGTNEIKKMIYNLPELQREIIKNHEKDRSGSLCKKDLENLKAWTLDPSVNKHRKKYLTKQGEEELMSLGTRFKDYFPELLQSKSADALTKKYKFRATETQRTIASMKYFVEGVFGNVTFNGEIVPNPMDTLLKLYTICKPWLEIMNSPSTNAEVNALINGPRLNQIVSDVSERLGFPNNLTFDDVLNMYTACTFERAWYADKLSPWCAAFTKDELEAFEYEEDLYYYYHGSYGQEMSSKIGCPPLQDMFDHFTKLENGNSNEEEPLGIFYFSHSTSLQLLFTTMGIAKDSTPLKASNYEEMENRKWRTSYLVPFAANFAAVLYKCDSSNKVRFYLNEKPLDYEGCEMGVCDWEYLKKKLGSSAFNCNVDFCRK